MAEQLSRVSARLLSAQREHGRSRAARLVAVSKTKPAAAVLEAYAAGQRHFGENYVQELVDKAPELPGDIAWHFIGHLQSNKAKVVARIPNLFVVESVDSAKLATALDRCVPRERAPLRVMVQVNTSGEDSKSGVEPSEATELVRFVASECPSLKVVGLMTIGRLGDVSPECFQCLASCRDSVLAAAIQGVPGADEFELSMGMSGDFELAIQWGSTNVRVGSTIFGDRDYGASRGALADAAKALESCSISQGQAALGDAETGAGGNAAAAVAATTTAKAATAPQLAAPDPSAKGAR